MIAAAKHPELVDALALICPGLHPRVDVARGERLRIALAFFTNRRKRSRSRWPTRRSSPTARRARPSSRPTRSACGRRRPSLLAASRFIDRGVARGRGKVRQPSLLMLAGHDRIVDNARTLAYFERHRLGPTAA